MNNTKEHQQLVNAILLAVGGLPYVRLQKRVVGVFQTVPRVNAPSRPVSIGLEGQSDITGILKLERPDMDGTVHVYGVVLEIEVKTGQGQLSDAQRKWRETVIRMGGVFIEARTVQDVLTRVNFLARS